MNPEIHIYRQCGANGNYRYIETRCYPNIQVELGVHITRARTEAASLSTKTGKHHMALQFPGVPPKKIGTRVGDVAAYNSLPRS